MTDSVPSRPLADKTENKIETQAPEFIIGIGASAGGLAPLQEFFRTISKENSRNNAYIVIQHLSARHKSIMDQLLQKETNLFVQQAVNRQKILRGNIYLIPPGKIMLLKNGRLILKPRENKKGISFPIDLFFQSLADEMREKAIGIIMSGTGSDGTRGIVKIKENGGLVIVQSLDSSKFNGMPQNAISTGVSDYEMAPEEMAPIINEYTGHNTVSKNLVNDAVQLTDVLVKIIRLLKNEYKVDFHRYKQEMLIRRITRRMHVRLKDDIIQYFHLLAEDENELKALFEDILVGITRFFRDEEAFQIMATKVVPELVERSGSQQIRVWIPGCSSGEEAYSLAILFLEYMEQSQSKAQLKIFATDINPRVLKIASEAIYPDNISQYIDEVYLSKYFILKDGKYYVKKALRECIVFTNHNLIQNAPFNRLDLISCRNLLIYFKSQTQKKLFAVFNFALKEDGVLFLGSGESAESFKEIFQPVSAKWKIYRSVFQSSIRLPNPKIETNNVSLVSTPALQGTRNTQAVYRNRMMESVCEMLVDEFSSAAMIIDDQFELIKYFGNAGRYLFVPNQPQNWNLLRMVKADIAAAISAGVRKAQSNGKRITYRQMKFDLNGEDLFCNLTIKPYQAKYYEQAFFLILIEEDEPTELNLEEAEMPVINATLIQRIKDLEHELTLSHESHQATIEELQTSNEELLAANEELQGTNEELQSVNEELFTMNAEHQSTIGELSDLNDDMDNLLSHTHIGILFLDAQLCIHRFNKAIAEEIKITSTDIGRPLDHFSILLQDINLKEMGMKILTGKETIEQEVYSQNEKWYNMRMLPYRADEGKVKGVVMTLIDISQIKGTAKLKKLSAHNQKLKDQLKKDRNSNDKFKLALENRQQERASILDSLPGMYFRFDQEGRCLDYKIAGADRKNLWFPKKELQGKQLDELFPSGFQVRIAIAIKEAIEKQTMSILELDWEENEKNRNYEVKISPLNQQEVTAIFIEVSREKQKDVLLHRQTHLLELVAANIPDGGLIVFDKSLTCKLVRGRLMALLKDEEILSEVLDESDPLLIACTQAFKNKTKAIEWKYNKDIYLASIHPVHDENGEINTAFALLQKITDAVKVQRTLQARLKDMEQFAYSVSHDLKTPLRSISGFAQLLQKRYNENLDQNGQEYLEYIVSNTQSMADLIHGLLDYAKLGATESKMEVVSIDKIVKEVVEKLSTTIEEKQVSVHIGELPPVMGYHAHYIQLFQNIIDNGIKFNKKKQKHIAISNTQSAGWATFTIQDNGIGISPRYKDKIFDVFAHLNTRDQYEGSGIGLAVCKRIVERLGGTIWVESEEGKGSAFKFTLPLPRE